MSRPLLGLILINTDQFRSIQEQLCSQQPQDKQAKLSQVIEFILMHFRKYMYFKTGKLSIPKKFFQFICLLLYELPENLIDCVIKVL